MINIIVGLVVLAILAAAILYIYRAKKSGVKCIGCPSGNSCSGHCSGGGCTGHCSGGCACEASANMPQGQPETVEIDINA